MKRISISVRCTVLMLVFSLLFSLSASAQQGKVNVDVKNVSLKEFFNVIVIIGLSEFSGKSC